MLQMARPNRCCCPEFNTTFSSGFCYWMDKAPAASSQLQDDQASSLYEAMPTYSAEQGLLNTLFLELYLLFWISVQDLAACNFYLCTARLIYNESMRGIMPLDQDKISLLLHGPYSCPFFFCSIHTYYFYITIIYIITKSETAFGCVFIAENLLISTTTAGDQLAYKPWASGTQTSTSNKQSLVWSAVATGPSG